MSKTNHVQGSVDGLCGIYCLMHFLQRAPRLSKKGRTKAHAAFAELLKDAQSIDLLNASNIAGGYYAADLVRIFNKTATRKRLPFVAAELETVANTLGLTSATSLLRQLLNERGSAIVSVNGGQHWVLAEKIGPNSEITVKDSGHVEKYRKDELKRVRDGFDGVALVPRRSSIGRAAVQMLKS